MGWGFFFMSAASVEYESEGLSGMHWLILAYLFHTIGELCASPVSLSFITKLAPQRWMAFMMGAYFASTGLGNKLAGFLGEKATEVGEMSSAEENLSARAQSANDFMTASACATPLASTALAHPLAPLAPSQRHYHLETVVLRVVHKLTSLRDFGYRLQEYTSARHRPE